MTKKTQTINKIKHKQQGKKEQLDIKKNTHKS